jgi:putative transposase
MKKYKVVLTTRKKKFLRQLLCRDRHSTRVITRARVLLMAHDGDSDRSISQVLGCSTATVHNQRKRYCERSTIKEAIHDAPRPGQPPKLTPRHEAFIVATAYTDKVPAGHAHWKPQGLKEALKEEAYDDIQDVSNETIRKLLIRHKLKPWREKNVVHTQALTPVPGANGRSDHPLHRASVTRP